MNGVSRPTVGIVIGDPCGIGPEVTVKAWATGRAQKLSKLVLLGNVDAVRDAVGYSKIAATVRQAASPEDLSDDISVIDVIDEGYLDPADITLGRDSTPCGKASADWLDQAESLAVSGRIGGVVMAPISTIAMKAAGVLDRVVSDPGEEYLTIFAGSLRVAHVTDHVPLRTVCETLSTDSVLAALRAVHSQLAKWGMANPRIGVCGLNPHAMGVEDETQIAPAVRLAVLEGIAAEGPLSPDAVFRQCIDGKYDIVLAMYHDQGHIAVKTWGFSGNLVMNIGRRPYVFVGTAHGTAFDIAGKGVADASMMLNAMIAAGSLAAGRGFPSSEELSLPAEQ